MLRPSACARGAGPSLPQQPWQPPDNSASWAPAASPAAPAHYAAALAHGSSIAQLQRAARQPARPGIEGTQSSPCVPTIPVTSALLRTDLPSLHSRLQSITSLHRSSIEYKGTCRRHRQPTRMCGIIGIFKHAGDANVEVYEGLLSLQHRGQDRCGCQGSSRLGHAGIHCCPVQHDGAVHSSRCLGISLSLQYSLWSGRARLCLSESPASPCCHCHCLRRGT